jgi:hypothetical protein
MPARKLPTNPTAFTFYRDMMPVSMHLLAPGEKKHVSRPATVTRDWDGIIRSHVAAGGNLGFQPGDDYIVIDVDIKRGIDGNQSLASWLSDKGITLPVTTEVKSPSGGRHLYFSRGGDSRRLWSSRRECPGVDFLTGASNVVCAGSAIGGEQYTFIRRCPPAPCPAGLLDALAFSGDEMDEVAKRPSLSLEELTEMVEKLPNPDLSFDSYLRVGMAIHFETSGSPEGFELWDSWAQKSEKYRSIDTSRRWGSFNSDGSFQGVAAWGTIDRLLRELDVPCFDSVEEALAAHGVTPRVVGAADEASSLAAAAPPLPPGLAGRIAEYILSVSISPLPEAALAASLNILSTMSRNRYVVGGAVRLNLMLMLVARTGSGKDAAFSQTARILAALGEIEHLAAGVTSGPALRKRVATLGGHYLSLHIDEASQWLAACKNGGQHELSTRFTAMELYTKSGSVLPGRVALSPSGKVDDRSTGAISRPFLSTLLATTPGRLMESLQSADFADGLLNRMIVLRTEQMPDLNMDVNPEAPIPQDILNDLRALSMPWDPIEDDKEDEKEAEDGEEIVKPAKRAEVEAPIHVPVDPAVVPRHRELMRWVRQEQLNIPDLWQRVPESVMKVAGIVAIGHHGVVDDEVYSWAYDLVVKRQHHLVDAIEREHAESECDALVKKMLQFIADPTAGAGDKVHGDLVKEGVKPVTLITRWFQRVPARQRKEILETLVESGQVGVSEVTKGDSHKKTKVYFAL